ncbi:myosin-2 essential light chain [Ditylenchus destructor]|uniref:Myosin-2 essential light chain n=1 Tax=Ditylenchus destructor TaxID=166010 RepID=A0AAD4RDZ8_9BILA|nr:myosin-2 essential light chain [Ditylenchus destructor]
MTSSNELADIHEVFQFYDTRGDGKVTVGQIGSCLRALGLTPTQADVVSLTQQWTDIDARISVEEFTPIYRKLKKDGGKSGGGKSEEELANALNNFDREGNGQIAVHDLKFLLTSCGEKLSADEAELLMHGCPAGSEGKVNISDFIRLITSI